MSVYGGKERSTNAVVLVLPVRDMQARSGISEFLCETKVNNIDKICVFASAHDKVCGFDVTMDEIS